MSNSEELLLRDVLKYISYNVELIIRAKSSRRHVRASREILETYLFNHWSINRIVDSVSIHPSGALLIVVCGI